ncbi:unnamed protein product [Albugo candida]|uniref:Uncharacterized protein n=1 Tax=Albugo candida TaxID=65357 RepID=A0A024FWJ7_9STRA|nr:unnamed protein product [Albugo candida]CCI11009.1 unnamed protein product [Albugo candida]|eukprot:CCI10749.1 unnamed protein product [Albugo candida]
MSESPKDHRRRDCVIVNKLYSKICIFTIPSLSIMIRFTYDSDIMPPRIPFLGAYSVGIPVLARTECGIDFQAVICFDELLAPIRFTKDDSDGMSRAPKRFGNFLAPCIICSCAVVLSLYDP